MNKKPHAEVAYILKGFPRLSETFISNEILLLEKMNLPLRIYSIKKGDETNVQNIHEQLLSPLRYLPNTSSLSATTLWVWLVKNLPQYVMPNLALCMRHPIRYFSTLKIAITMCSQYRSMTTGAIKKVFIKEFLQAAYIADDILKNDKNIAHIHGHFCHGATTITWFISKLTAKPYSFTAHAKDIYQAHLNPGDLLKRKLDSAKFVTTCTSSNKDYLDKASNYKTPIHKVYHGLNTALFHPNNSNSKSNSKHLILSVGRLVHKKGFTHLIDACAVLNQRGITIKCLIIGEKGDAYKEIIQRIADQKLEQIVEIRPAIAQHELREFYQKATVFTLPCQIMEDGDRDGIPNVIVEAMAMGLPVVSTNISGIPEIIKHEQTGLLSEEKNAIPLADNIERVLKDINLQKHLSKNARQEVCKHFDSSETTYYLKTLFEKSISETALA